MEKLQVWIPSVIKCWKKHVILSVFVSLFCLIYRCLNRNFQRSEISHLLCHSSKREIHHWYPTIDQYHYYQQLAKIWKNCFKEAFNHLISNNLLYTFQSGFIPGHSTVHQLIEIYYRICMSLDDHCIIVRDSSVV